MSWDFSVEVDVGGSEPIELHDFKANYTYNVSPMFYEAFKGILDDGISGLNGASCKDARAMIEIAFKRMFDDPEKYQAWNPENGWGSYEGAMNLLCVLRGWCIAAPLARMRVS